MPAALRRGVLRRAVALIPESGWYKSVGHQLRWLHHLSFLGRRALRREPVVLLFRSRARAGAVRAGVAAGSSQRHRREAAIRSSVRGSAAASRSTGCCIADSMVRLPNHPVMITDRICMAHGLEARSPFMDHELAEFAARLPAGSRCAAARCATSSASLRARYLPPQILDRPKQGFSSALPYMLQSEYATLYELPSATRGWCRRASSGGAHPGTRGGAAGGARRPRQPAVAADQRGGVVPDGDPGGTD